jgi:hypothetical protein
LYSATYFHSLVCHHVTHTHTLTRPNVLARLRIAQNRNRSATSARRQRR